MSLSGYTLNHRAARWAYRFQGETFSIATLARLPGDRSFVSSWQTSAQPRFCHFRSLKKSSGEHSYVKRRSAGASRFEAWLLLRGKQRMTVKSRTNVRARRENLGPRFKQKRRIGLRTESDLRRCEIRCVPRGVPRIHRDISFPHVPRVRAPVSHTIVLKCGYNKQCVAQHREGATPG